MATRTQLSRRDVLVVTALGSLGLATAGLGRAKAEAAPPNIVFILADDFGYADLSCYGRRDFTTPNIDRLAAEGMKFMQAYANSAVCTASRVAIITGRYQYRLAVGLEEPLGAPCRPAAGPSYPAIAAQEGRLRHDSHRQMAPRGFA